MTAALDLQNRFWRLVCILDSVIAVVVTGTLSAKLLTADGDHRGVGPCAEPSLYSLSSSSVSARPLNTLSIPLSRLGFLDLH
jgi:hypothetical protein